MPILDFNDPNPAFGGGGGGSGLTETEIDTSGGSGDTTLPAFSGATTGSYYLFTLSDPEYAGTIIADGSDTIDGAGTLAVGIGESVLLVVGATEWEEVARGPGRVLITLAAGGDIVTLPALSTLPTGSVRVITYNDPGTSDPVEVQKDAGDAYSPVDYTGYIFTLYETQIFYHTGSAWEVKVPPADSLPEYLTMLDAFYQAATTASASNTIPRFDSGVPRLLIPGLAGDWVVARNADRYVEAVIDVPDTGTPGTTALAMFGSYSGTNALGILRTDGTGWAWYSPNWASNVRVGATYTAWRNQRVYFGAFYDHSAAEFTLYVRIGSGSQTTYTLALANAGSSVVDYVSPGGNISNITSTTGMNALWMANYTADPGDAHRDVIQTAMMA